MSKYAWKSMLDGTEVLYNVATGEVLARISSILGTWTAYSVSYKQGFVDKEFISAQQARAYAESFWRY